MAIADDFTIFYADGIRMISHSLNTNIYSVQQMYSYLQDTFDEQSQMDDTVPMSAQTPSEYTLINGWFMPEKTMRYLGSGSIQTNGWSASVYIAQGTTDTPFESADIGKEISGSTTGYVGTLLDYQTDNLGFFKLYIRASSSADTFDTAEQLEVSGGVGQLTTAGASPSGESVYTNIYTLGSIVPGTYTYVQQSGSIIDGYQDGWWQEGFIDVIIKTQEASVEIDDSTLNVFAREYGNTYDNFIIIAPGGRNAVPLSTGTDGFNTTPSESIDHLTASVLITFYTESQLFDLDNGSGPRPYKCVIDCGTHSLADVYELTKYITNRPYRDDIDQDPVNYVTGAVYQAVSESFTPVKVAPFGTYTGKFFAARSVWLTNLATGDVKNFSLIDDNGVTQDPPNTVSVTVTSVSGSDRVAVFRLTGAGGDIFKNEYYTSASLGSNQSAGTLVTVSGSIATDVPKASVIRIVEDSYEFYTWTNGGTPESGTFFLTASVTLTKDYADGSASYVPIIDVQATTTSVSNTLVQVTNIPVLIRVRNGTLNNGILPFEIEGTIGENGLSVAAIRTTDTINVG